MPLTSLIFLLLSMVSHLGLNFHGLALACLSWELETLSHNPVPLHEVLLVHIALSCEDHCHTPSDNRVHTLECSDQCSGCFESYALKIQQIPIAEGGECNY